MSILEAIILGIVQGLSEFIPISSTAHMTIVGKYMGLIDPNNPAQWTAFIAVVQLGTLAAVLIYFWKEVLATSKSFVKENILSRKKLYAQSSESRMGWFVIAGSVPIVTIGMMLKPIIESNFTKDLSVIGGSLIALAVVLFIAEKVSPKSREMNELCMRDAVWVGLAQCVALIPGASRSGTTITMGLFAGLKREVAARFSFLLGIPAILGSGLYEFYSEFSHFSGEMLLPTITASIVSGIVGWYSIDFLLKYLAKHSTMLFVGYRIILGVALLLFVA